MAKKEQQQQKPSKQNKQTNKFKNKKKPCVSKEHTCLLKTQWNRKMKTP